MVPAVVVHGYLLQKGIDYASLGVIGTISSVAIAASTFLFAGLADRFKSFKSFKTALAVAVLGLSLKGGTLLFLCIFLPDAKPTLIFAVYAIATAVYDSLNGIKYLLQAILIVRISSTKRYGRLQGAAVLIATVLSVASGALVAYISGIYSIEGVIIRLSVASCAAVVISCSLTMLFLDVNPEKAAERNPPVDSPFKAISKVIKIPQSKMLVLTSILRGVQLSGIYFFSAIGVTKFGAGSHIIGFIAMALPVAEVSSAMFLMLLQPRLGSGKMAFYAALFAVSGALIISFARVEILYAIGYGVIHFSHTLISNSLGVGVMEMVPADIVGRAMAVKQTIVQISNAFFTFVFGAVLQSTMPLLLFIVAGTALFSNGMYFYQACKRFSEREA